MENAPIAPEVQTHIPAVNPLQSPYLGLGSATGGLDGFDSQTFTDVGGSGVDITVHYSRNNRDGTVLEGPDLYVPPPPPPGSQDNPDRHNIGEYALRVNRNEESPVTIVMTFSVPVYVNELLIGSLSTVSDMHEHAFLRAFSTPDATGGVVTASYFENASARTDSSGLLIDPLTEAGSSPLTNLLANVAVTPNLTLDVNGIATNVGGGTDTGIYHVIGMNPQEPLATGHFGRILVRWQGDPIRSVAFTTWASAISSFDDFALDGQWISTILSPVAFTPADMPPVIPEPALAGLLLSGLLGLGILRRRRLKGRRPARNP